MKYKNKPWCECISAVGKGKHAVCDKLDEECYKEKHPIRYWIYNLLN